MTEPPRTAPLRRLLLQAACMAPGWGLPGWVSAQGRVAHRRPDGTAFTFVSFSALPVGGVVDWRRAWERVLGGLGQALQQPVSMGTEANESTLARAMAQQQVDLVFADGLLALEAVTAGHMRVLAQLSAAPAEAPRALLVIRKEGMPQHLSVLFSTPERWRLARGDARSLTGFLVPQAQLLLPYGLRMEAAFRDEFVGMPQDLLLTVANGHADLALVDSRHFVSFEQQFPQEAQRLRVLWQSAPVPGPFLLVKEGLSVAWRAQVRDFFLGLSAAEQRLGWQGVLSALQVPGGFVHADNRALLPVSELLLTLGRQRARMGEWVSEQAREARLARLARTHAQQRQVLLASERTAPP